MRSLASDERAGSALRRQATERRLETLRAYGSRIILILGSTYALVAVLIWFFGGWTRDFALGAWTATIIAVGHHGIWQMSGSANFDLGALGEKWTAQALRKVGDRRWRLINDLSFERHNIDHVMVGPAGIVVVETKTTSKSWTDRDRQQWIDRGSAQADSYSRKLRNYLKPHAGEAPVLGVVALWPDRDRIPTKAVGGISIVGGATLTEFVEALPHDQLDERAIDAVYDRLVSYVDGRDAHILEKAGPPPRTFDDWNFEFLQVVVGLMIGLLLSILSLKLKPWPLAYGGVAALMGATAIIRRRTQRLTTLVTSAAAGCLVIVMWLLVVVIQHAI